MRGHIRRRGKASFEYIVDIGTASAQRCQGCGRFWVERKPKESCPKCGGQLLETEERRRAIKGGFATQQGVPGRPEQGAGGRRGTHLRSADPDHGQGVPASRVAAGRQGHAATDDLCKLHHARPGAHHPPSRRPAAAEAHARRNQRPLRLPARGGARPRRGGLSPPRCAACTPSCTAPVTTPCAGAGSRSTRSMPPIRLRPAPSTQRGCRSGAASSSRPSWPVSPTIASFALWRLLAMTGMRRGEALGLAWDDLDMEGGP